MRRAWLPNFLMLARSRNGSRPVSSAVVIDPSTAVAGRADSCKAQVVGSSPTGPTILDLTECRQMPPRFPSVRATVGRSVSSRRTSLANTTRGELVSRAGPRGMTEALTWEHVTSSTSSGDCGASLRPGAGISRVDSAEVRGRVTGKTAGRHPYGRAVAAPTPTPPPGGLSRLARRLAGGGWHAPPVQPVSHLERSASM